MVKNKINKITILFLFINFAISIVILIKINNIINIVKNVEKVEFELKTNTDNFMSDWEPSIRNMLIVCDYYNIKYPEIVTSQAVLESGNFKSPLFKTKNNPFGLYNNKTGDYFTFEHWTQSVQAYKNMIESKYQGGDYYKFLQKLPYASDKNYIKKVRFTQQMIKCDTTRIK